MPRGALASGDRGALVRFHMRAQTLARQGQRHGIDIRIQGLGIEEQRGGLKIVGRGH